MSLTTLTQTRCVWGPLGTVGGITFQVPAYIDVTNVLNALNDAYSAYSSLKNAADLTNDATMDLVPMQGQTCF